MEKIKYHQNGIGNEYGEDRTLTNNWNPDIDYGNEYANIYFRIDADYYEYPFTGYTPEQKQEFINEVSKIFKELGWKTDKEANNGCCTEISQGKQHLYLHPQNFSGEVLKNNVKEIAEALKDNSTFKLRWVDLYETVYDISDQEYEEYLNTKNDEIRTILFEKCQTKRTNKFYYVFDVARDLASQFRLVRIGLNDGMNFGSGQTIEYICKIIEQMESEKYLVFAENEIGNKLVRSINKTEQKKMKLKIA